MKIIRLTTLLDFGGQEKKYISFTDTPELLQNKYIFAAIGYGGNTSTVLKERGFRTFVFNRNFSIKNFENILFLYRFFKKEKPDIVHTAAAEANFHGVLAAKLAGVKKIYAEEIGIPNHSRIAKLVFKFVYKFVDKVICVSEAVKAHLVDTKEIPARKGEVIYNPVSLPKQFQREKAKNFHLVYVGRLEKVKNVETLIRVFAKINDKRAKLTIVGDGREKEILHTLAKELNVWDRINFTGFSDTPEKFLASADLYILPSYSEGFGIAAVEAMFQKVPVLCSEVGGIPEFIKNNENGWLFDPKNVKGLTEKINSIIALSEKERETIAIRGYDTVINRFTVEKYIENLENLYASL